MSNYFDLQEYGLIRVSGIDAAKFLQGQITCDVREVNEQQSRLGAHCDAKGRIQVCFRLYQFQENYYFRLLKTLIPHTLNLLQKYAVFSKVKLEDVSNEWSIFGLCGNITEFKSAKIFSKVTENPPRFEILTSRTSIPEYTAENFNDWKLLDIRAGIPEIFPETCGLFTPHDINYPQIGGVSFNKGCYTGQEIIARMQFLGKLKQHMYHVQFMSDIIPAPASSLIDHTGNRIGTLVSTALTGNRSFESLAVIQDKFLNDSIKLENSAQSILQILDLPYTV